MSWTNDELMAHALVGDLTPDQAAAWEERCNAAPELRTELEGLLPMVSQVKSMPDVAFDIGFVDRTMARVAADLGGAADVSPGAGQMADDPIQAGRDQSVSNQGNVDQTADAFEPDSAVAVLSFDAALRRQFRWVASAAAAAAVVLLALNVGLFQDPEQSAWEAAVGLDPITIESVYAIGEELE